MWAHHRFDQWKVILVSDHTVHISKWGYKYQKDDPLLSIKQWGRIEHNHQNSSNLTSLPTLFFRPFHFFHLFHLACPVTCFIFPSRPRLFCSRSASTCSNKADSSNGWVLKGPLARLWQSLLLTKSYDRSVDFEFRMSGDEVIATTILRKLHVRLCQTFNVHGF